MTAQKPNHILLEELNKCHERIMQLKADPKHWSRLITGKDVMNCFTPPSRPDRPYDPTNEHDYAMGFQYLASLKTRGFLRYTGLKNGGTGYEVPAKFLRGENAPKTEVVDARSNLLSKLKPHHGTALGFLTDVCNNSPSTSVGALVELLKSSEGQKYLALFVAKPTPASPQAIDPATLGAINLEHVSFEGENSCALKRCNLWQAYQIGRALDTTRSSSPACQEAEPAQEVAEQTEEAESQDATDAPF